LKLQRTQRSTDDSSPARFRIPDWLLLVAVCAFFFFWKLSAFGLIGADEPRYAQVAREMLARHDWITPTLGGTPWLEKPPLYYWQAMIAYRLFGVSDWAARLPSAFDALLLVFAAYWFLGRFRRGSELDGALTVAVAAGVVGYARAASMDMPLAASFTAALLAWFAWLESLERKYLAAFWGLLGLAMLAKGPVAPFLAAIILGMFTMLRRNPLAMARTVWLPGLAVSLAITLPWYIAVQVRNPQFFRVFILEHNLARFGTNLYHHTEPFWYYLPVAFLGWMPWSVLAVAAIVWSVRRIKANDSDQFNTFLLIWIAVFLVFFSGSQSKLPGYLLPAIPAGLILISQWLRARASTAPSLPLAALHAGCASILILPALMVHYLFLDRQHLVGRAALMPLLVTVAVAVSITLLVLRHGWRVLRVATLVPAIVAAGVLLRSGGETMNSTLSARSVVAALSEYGHDHLPVAAYLVPRETEFGLAFYRDQVIPRYELGKVPAGEHLLVAAQGYPKGVANAAGRKETFLRNLPAQKLDLYYVPPK
jgi:4-amino-4-deoxy-L-arabinose transferase-like glycosyltransferase